MCSQKTKSYLPNHPLANLLLKVLVLTFKLQYTTKARCSGAHLQPQQLWGCYNRRLLWVCGMHPDWAPGWPQPTIQTSKANQITAICGWINGLKCDETGIGTKLISQNKKKPEFVYFGDVGYSTQGSTTELQTQFWVVCLIYELSRNKKISGMTLYPLWQRFT